MTLAPGYQVPFAEAIRRDAGIPTFAVGLIADAVQAEQIVSLGQGDAMCLARAMLRDPYWPRHAAKALGVAMLWPDAYKLCDVRPFGQQQLLEIFLTPAGLRREAAFQLTI